MKRFAIAAPLLFLLLLSAQPACAAQNLQQVLQQLDRAASNFRSASAEFEFKNIQTEPVPNTDIMTGVVYYEHHGGALRMAAHIKKRDGQPFGAVYTYDHGVFQLYNKQLNQVRKMQNATNLAAYLALGAGASGQQLQDMFELTYLGQETIDGVMTEKLQLIPKAQKARNMFPKITIWVDPARDVYLKQVFDEGQGMSRICTYTHIQFNHPIGADKFTFRTNRKTQFLNQ